MAVGQTCAEDRDCASLFCEAVPDPNGVVVRGCAPVRFVNVECSGADINRGGVGNISKVGPFGPGFVDGGAFDVPVSPPPLPEAGAGDDADDAGPAPTDGGTDPDGGAGAPCSTCWPIP
jgi:hypothetical protein